MSESAAEKLDKKEIGARIRKLRRDAGLKQWQLAELLGATQPAVHMYERGILPQPGRLLDLARIGNTTIEWILTGRHLENGSSEMARVPAAQFDLASRLARCSEQECETLASALEVITGALAALRESGGGSLPAEMSGFQETARALSAAVSIHRSLCRTLISQNTDRFRGFGRTEPALEGDEGAVRAPEPAPARGEAALAEPRTEIPSRPRVPQTPRLTRYSPLS